MAAPLRRLHDDVRARRHESPDSSRTAKLLAAGPAKIARKLGEEAIEVAIEMVRGDKRGVINETADLLYHLMVLLAHQNIALDEVLDEIERRERLFGIAEKPPKGIARKIVALHGRERARKRA